MSHVAWSLDPDDPRAPPQSVWDAMTPEERQEVIDSLPTEFPVTEANPPEGDHHWHELTRSRTTLTRWFRRSGRRVYVSGNLPVYYPAEAMFSPDVVAVVDVDPHWRDSWIVSAEAGRGLDFAIEIIVSGRRRKDLVVNVERYARLGISEYFVFDQPKRRLLGYHLAEAGASRYTPILAQQGKYPSHILGLELSVEGEHLRFSAADALLPDNDELIARLGHAVSESEQRLIELEAMLEEEQRRREEEQRRREEEQRRREEEQRRREGSEREVARLRAELEQLRKR